MEVSQEEDKTEKLRKSALDTEQNSVSKIIRLSKSRRNKTAKHFDAKYIWHDMLEIN